MASGAACAASRASYLLRWRAASLCREWRVRCGRRGGGVEEGRHLLCARHTHVSKPRHTRAHTPVYAHLLALSRRSCLRLEAPLSAAASAAGSRPPPLPLVGASASPVMPRVGRAPDPKAACCCPFSPPPLPPTSSTLASPVRRRRGAASANLTARGGVGDGGGIGAIMATAAAGTPAAAEAAATVEAAAAAAGAAGTSRAAAARRPAVAAACCFAGTLS